MQSKKDDEEVKRAAKMALETGNAKYILTWIPEESANTMKNLLEKACCERNTQKNVYEQTAYWYFKTVSRLCSRHNGPRNKTTRTKWES